MTTGFSAIPIIANWCTVQDAYKSGCNPPNRCDTDQSVGSDAKCVDWKDAAIEGEDREFGEGDATIIHFLQK